MFILELQSIQSESEQTKAPSTNSWWFCFSTASIIVC